MELENGLKPSIIRTNARHRGPTEFEKYSNLMGEIYHDILLLDQTIHTGDEYKGQTDFIWDNMATYYSGTGTDLFCNISTATTLYNQGDVLPVVGDLKLNDGTWSTYGGCTKTAITDGTTLESNGTAYVAGIEKNIDVTDGMLLYLRLKVKYISGDISALQIGSKDINQGEGFFTKIPSGDVPLDGTPVYIGCILECKHKEAINLNIDIANSVSAMLIGKLEVLEISLTSGALNKLHLQALNTTIQSRVGLLEEKIQNILKNM